MLLRKKNRKRAIAVVLILLFFVLWRGLTSAAKKDFSCEYKLIYAVCVPKHSGAKAPGIMDIIKAGIKF